MTVCYIEDISEAAQESWLGSGREQKLLEAVQRTQPEFMAYASMSLSKRDNFERRQKGCCRSCLRNIVRYWNVVLLLAGLVFLAYGGKPQRRAAPQQWPEPISACFAAYLAIEQKAFNVLSGMCISPDLYAFDLLAGLPATPAFPSLRHV